MKYIKSKRLGIEQGRVLQKTLKEFCMDEAINLLSSIEQLSKARLTANEKMTMCETVNEFSIHQGELRDIPPENQ
jgi:hypothetical protein